MLFYFDLAALFCHPERSAAESNSKSDAEHRDLTLDPSALNRKKRRDSAVGDFAKAKFRLRPASSPRNDTASKRKMNYEL